MKMEVHKSSGIREFMKSLHSTFGCRVPVCRPAFSRHSSRAMLAAGDHRQLSHPCFLRQATLQGAGSLRCHEGPVSSFFPSHHGCVRWDLQRAGAPSRPILLAAPSTASACTPGLCSWDANSPGLALRSWALLGSRNQMAAQGVHPSGVRCGVKLLFFPPLDLALVTGGSYSRIASLRNGQ